MSRANARMLLVMALALSNLWTTGCVLDQLLGLAGGIGAGAGGAPGGDPGGGGLLAGGGGGLPGLDGGLAAAPFPRGGPPIGGGFAPAPLGNPGNGFAPPPVGGGFLPNPAQRTGGGGTGYQPAAPPTGGGTTITQIPDDRVVRNDPPGGIGGLGAGSTDFGGSALV